MTKQIISVKNWQRLYAGILPILFSLEPEKAHSLVLRTLKWIPKSVFPKIPETKPTQAMGLLFKHPLGLAAGLDKNAEYLDALAKLGFSFIEVGTVTPKAQVGNLKPRLFRIPRAYGLINRMGFNNNGVENLINNIKKSSYQGILGINIGKNKDTSLTKALDDYLFCLEQVYPFAAYVTINVSSPNTEGLRELQGKDYLENLLKFINKRRLQLADKHKRYVPLVLKISPDETKSNIKTIADIAIKHHIEGIIATNTSVARFGLTDKISQEKGGLSGKPLFKRATECLSILREHAGDKLTLIASGGVMDGDSAEQKITSGASLIQIYTGLIYSGPGIISDILHKLE